MSIKEALQTLSDKSFEQMPEDIAKKLKDGIENTIKGDFKNNALKIGDTIPSFVLNDIFENEKNE